MIATLVLWEYIEYNTRRDLLSHQPVCVGGYEYNEMIIVHWRARKENNFSNSWRHSRNSHILFVHAPSLFLLFMLCHYDSTLVLLIWQLPDSGKNDF